MRRPLAQVPGPLIAKYTQQSPSSSSRRRRGSVRWPGNSTTIHPPPVFLASMHIDPLLALASFLIGIVVGLTGMGGGALMTPVLVLFFNIAPLTAVSSDLVSSAVMKPVGSFVHLRNGTVRMDLVKWLCLGSVPSAFAGVLIARALGHGTDVQNLVQKALGVALVIAAAGLFA